MTDLYEFSSWFLARKVISRPLYPNTGKIAVPWPPRPGVENCVRRHTEKNSLKLARTPLHHLPHSSGQCVQCFNHKSCLQCGAPPLHARAPACCYDLKTLKSWATSLPADVGYGESVDIRRVVTSWPAKLNARKGRFDQVDEFPLDPAGRMGEVSTGAGGREYDSDEASLWWYTYGCTRRGEAAGVSKRVSHPCTGCGKGFLCRGTLECSGW